ncbi:single-strand DNA endonuclease ASTE1-like, partial [Eucyclogobius newberryi]|uniref:single-strand DNA endonuclease ASTE1-like n=1 Tax=Eucyclogobius newberryi TaxID=166745 RepID=UPI003B5C727C
FDQTHGGEYRAFEDLLEKFFGALQDCYIAPYVVFDGCSDKKLETEKERTEQRIREAHHRAETGKVNNKNILPTLIWEVFRQTLDRLKVPLVRSYTEADPQVAALAHEWICPVLSNDSDFFIFHMKGGFLPTAQFRWQQVVQRGAHKYIPCQRYFSSRFCEVNKLRLQLLPVFAVLAGNDCVRIPTPRNATTGNNRLDSLLQWIRSLNLEDPLEVIQAALRDTPQQQELRRRQEAAAHYSLPLSPLSAFFCEGTTPPLPPQMAGVVPDWMRVPLTKAQFSSDFLDVVNFQRVGLSVVVDHKDKPSANEVSLPLRRVLYGLLLGPDTSLRVEERDRHGLNVKYTHVQPEAPVGRKTFSIMTLEQVVRLKLSVFCKWWKAPQETEDQRRQVLLDALGLNRQFLSSLPSHLSHLALPLAATCYWLKEATPPKSLLKALLIGWCKGDELRSEAAQDPDVQRPLDLDWCHQLNQWQSCFRDSFLLNQLLGEPLPQPTIAGLYSGTLLHVLLQKLKSERLDKVSPGISSDKVYLELLEFATTHGAAPPEEPASPPEEPAAPPEEPASPPEEPAAPPEEPASPPEEPAAPPEEPAAPPEEPASPPEEPCKPVPKMTDMCRPVPKMADMCRPDPKMTDMCRPVPKMADMCRPDPKMADMCRPVPKMADMCRPVPKMADMCRPVPKMADMCRPVPKMADICEP